jgi:copper chaperone
LRLPDLIVANRTRARSLARSNSRGDGTYGGLDMQTYNIDKPEAVAELWETRVLGIEGMTCDNCVRTLTKALKRVNGIKDVNVDRENARAEITFDTTKTDMPAIHEAILRSGYKPTREVPA